MPSGPIRKLPAGGGWRVYVSVRTRIQPNQTPRACWAPCAGLGPSHRRLRFSVFTRRGCGPAAPTLHGAAAAPRICRGRVDVRGDDSLDLVESAFGSVLERRGGAQKGPQVDSNGTIPPCTASTLRRDYSGVGRSGAVRDHLEQPAGDRAAGDVFRTPRTHGGRLSRVGSRSRIRSVS